MIYTVSDIHGNYDKYKKMLETINFAPEDTLHVLGDVIDRGGDGFKIMLDMAKRPNVVNLLGNHEAMSMKDLPGILRTIGTDGVGMNEEEEQAMELWFWNGGELSLADFLWLDNEQEKIVWEYMKSMPLYKELEVNGRKFILLMGDWRISPLTDHSRIMCPAKSCGADQSRIRCITRIGMWCLDIRQCNTLISVLVRRMSPQKSITATILSTLTVAVYSQAGGLGACAWIQWRNFMFETEKFEVQLTNPMLYDRLHTLSAEYSVSVEFLVNVAVKRLVDDIDFVRNLRMGKTGGT